MVQKEHETFCVACIAVQQSQLACVMSRLGLENEPVIILSLTPRSAAHVHHQDRSH